MWPRTKTLKQLVVSLRETEGCPTLQCIVPCARADASGDWCHPRIPNLVLGLHRLPVCRLPVKLEAELAGIFELSSDGQYILTLTCKQWTGWWVGMHWNPHPLTLGRDGGVWCAWGGGSQLMRLETGVSQ